MSKIAKETKKWDGPKECTKCKTTKTPENFNGRRSWCKKCSSELGNKWNKSHQNSQKKKDYILEYRKNPENRIRLNELARKRYHLNIEKQREQKREYERKNIKKVRKRQKEYRRKNPEKFRSRAKEHYYKNKNNPIYKINRCLSLNLRIALKENKNGEHWENLVEYTLSDLKNHLESKFTEGMTWENWGIGEKKWQIDHILPKELFCYDTEKDAQFKICWSLSNLQPLWSEDNDRKSDYLPDGRMARNLTKQEKLEYLKSLGYKIENPPESKETSGSESEFI